MDTQEQPDTYKRAAPESFIFTITCFNCNNTVEDDAVEDITSKKIAHIHNDSMTQKTLRSH